jgi:arylsulfatase A-like enzyme
MKRFTSLVLTGWCLFAGAATTWAAKPNVIVVMTDDQGLGFNDDHVSPMCTPIRGQHLTGLDAARNGDFNLSSGRALLSAYYVYVTRENSEE